MFAAFLTAFAAGIAYSASFTYSGHRKEIKAGVLIFPGRPTPPAALVFYMLNQRPDINTQGWEFVNPLAPPGVSKNMAGYWEVKIDAGFADLSQFDVLYVDPTDEASIVNYRLFLTYREKLRKLGDAGVLWRYPSSAPTEILLNVAVGFISWGGESTTFHKNARHTGYSCVEVSAPLVLKWSFDEPRNVPEAAEPTGSSPAILNDMIFYVDGVRGRFALHAFDLSPAQDNSDDGIPDYATGVPYDEVWTFNCDAPASSPTVAYVPLVKDGPPIVPAVFVARMDGSVLAFNAATGALLRLGVRNIPRVILPPVNPPHTPDDITGIINIPAPTYFDGVVYAGDGAGGLRAYNLLDSTASWKWPSNPLPNPNLPPTLNSPTVGYFRNPTTGSVDQLVYLAARGKPGSVNGCIYSFPIKVFNEKLTPARDGDNKYQVRNYNQMPIKKPNLGDPHPYHLYYTQATGGPPLPISADVFGTGTFKLAATPPPGASVFADYEVDTASINPAPMYRQRIDVKNPPPTPNPPGFGVISTPAAAPNDTLYYATENGQFYAVIEDAWGTTTKWRWYLGDPGPMAMLGGKGDAVGSPAVGNNMVYYAVNGAAGGCILAFHADPVFRIDIGDQNIDPGRPVEVRQIDTMDPGPGPKLLTGAAEGTDTSRRRVHYKIDYDRGWLTFENFRDPLSASQDLEVRYFRPTASGPEPVGPQIHSAFPLPGDQYPNDRWNNLAWCLRVPADEITGSPITITSSPMLMGSMLYFGDSQGRLHTVDVERVSQETPELGLTVANEYNHWGWPSLDQPALGGAIISTVAGAQGNIAVSTAQGLFVLHNGLTLVADSNRVLEMDAGGRVVWSCDATTSSTHTRLDGTSTTVTGVTTTPFNKPSVARRIGAGRIMVADTGNNRVVIMDKAGNALVEISEILDPSNVLPPGPPLKLKLNAPTDVWMTEELMDRDPMSPTYGIVTAYRFMIADTGNYRVIEVAVIWNADAGRYETPVLIWTTRTLEQGKRYRYISARRYPKLGGGTEVICVVSNFVPNPSGLETTGGAIVTIDGSYGTGSDPTYRGGLIAADGVRRFADRCDGTPLGPSEPRPTIRLVNPTFFTREFRAGGTFTDIIGDSMGLYAVEFTIGSAVPSAPPRIYKASQHKSIMPNPDPMMPPIITSRPLAVSYAQLLPSGNILVTNKAPNLGQGPAHGAQGEVFELRFDPTQPVDPWSIVWPNAGVEPGRGSYSLQQPSSAERLYE